MAINVMIVDDSIFIRVLLKDILESTEEEQIKVVASVANGVEALREIRNNKDIDVVTLDVRMPEKDGLETLKEMMKIKKLPVIMISSYTSAGAKQTIEALSYGAVDVITKSSDENANSLYDMQKEIRSKIIAAYKSKPKIIENDSSEIPKAETTQVGIRHIVGIGASTGGPAALKILLSGIPSDFVSPIVIAQHMPEGEFINSLAEKLNETSVFRVKTIENGEEIETRTAYLCPGGVSVEVFRRGSKLHLVLTRRNENNSHYKPNVDILLSSISRLDKDIKKTAVVLTGMGDDGSKGCLAIYREGGVIITESEKTSVVYGMPKKVAELPIKKHIADIEKIMKYIVREKI